MDKGPPHNVFWTVLLIGVFATAIVVALAFVIH